MRTLAEILNISKQDLASIPSQLVKQLEAEIVHLNDKIVQLDVQMSELLADKCRLSNANIDLNLANIAQENQLREMSEQVIKLNDQLVVLRERLFKKGKKKDKKESRKPKSRKKKKNKEERTPKVQKLSDRYPDIDIYQLDVDYQVPPACSCCSTTMQDSGMTADSEYLDIKPAEFRIIQQKRHKYRCTHCHSKIETAPANPRIQPGGSYSDNLIIDVAVSKFGNLIPIERYAEMAAQNGLHGLPPNSLINGTHALAKFVVGCYEKIKQEVLLSTILHADETPHRMLEGCEKTLWYLWGFSNEESSYFDIQDTRSADVASELLLQSQCAFLVSDRFSGYSKSVNVTNEKRARDGQLLIQNCYCNAHAFRKFREAESNYPDQTKQFLEDYGKIYELYDQLKETLPQERRSVEAQILLLFRSMKKRAIQAQEQQSVHSSFGKALTYLLNSFQGLIVFAKNPPVPIDNNHQERLLRRPVIGRKTWLGTHSLQGAQTTAILFSLATSCRLNGSVQKPLNVVYKKQKGTYIVSYEQLNKSRFPWIIFTY